MVQIHAIRLVAAAALLAVAACAPVFTAGDYAGLTPVAFGQDAEKPAVIGQR